MPGRAIGIVNVGHGGIGIPNGKFGKVGRLGIGGIPGRAIGMFSVGQGGIGTPNGKLGNVGRLGIGGIPGKGIGIAKGGKGGNVHFEPMPHLTAILRELKVPLEVLPE